MQVTIPRPQPMQRAAEMLEVEPVSNAPAIQIEQTPNIFTQAVSDRDVTDRYYLRAHKGRGDKITLIPKQDLRTHSVQEFIEAVIQSDILIPGEDAQDAFYERVKHAYDLMEIIMYGGAFLTVNGTYLGSFEEIPDYIKNRKVVLPRSKKFAELKTALDLYPITRVTGYFAEKLFGEEETCIVVKPGLAFVCEYNGKRKFSLNAELTEVENAFITVHQLPENTDRLSQPFVQRIEAEQRVIRGLAQTFIDSTLKDFVEKELTAGTPVFREGYGISYHNLALLMVSDLTKQY